MFTDPPELPPLDQSNDQEAFLFIDGLWFGRWFVLMVYRQSKKLTILRIAVAGKEVATKITRDLQALKYSTALPVLFLMVAEVAQPDERLRVEKILTQEIHGSLVQTLKISPDTITAVVLVPQGTYIAPTLRKDAQTQLAVQLGKGYKLNLHLVQELPLTAQ